MTRLPLLVPLLSRRRAAPPSVVVRRWGDPAAVLAEHPADRLDTPPQTAVNAVLMLVDERDYRSDGRSSSAMLLCQAAVARMLFGVVFRVIGVRCSVSARAASSWRRVAKTRSEIRRRSSRSASTRVLPALTCFAK